LESIWHAGYPQAFDAQLPSLKPYYFMYIYIAFIPPP